MKLVKNRIVTQCFGIFLSMYILLAAQNVSYNGKLERFLTYSLIEDEYSYQTS